MELINSINITWFDNDKDKEQNITLLFNNEDLVKVEGLFNMLSYSASVIDLRYEISYENTNRENNSNA